MERIRLRDRIAFEDDKMARHRLMATARCQADLYCLRSGQAQALHAHADQDKLDVGVEGVGRIQSPLVVLVLVVPPPKHA